MSGDELLAGKLSGTNGLALAGGREVGQMARMKRTLSLCGGAMRPLAAISVGAALLCGLVHCNVGEPAITTPVADPGLGDAGVAHCGSAFAVAMSDFQSTNIAIVSLEGKVLSSSLISSASAPPGTSAPLSGDVVLPFASPASGELVLLDRYPNSTLTWLTPRAAAVRGQLNVGTGFAANPRDYLEVEPGIAYISRYEKNAKPGAAAFDGGDDILIVDTQTPKITGSIAFPKVDAEPTIQNRPDRLLKVGSRVWVTLQRISADFSTVGTGSIGIVDASKNVSTFALAGLKNCSTLSLSPNGKQVIVTCSGAFDFNKPDFKRQISESAIVVLDASGDTPKEVARIAATTAPFGPNVAHASDRFVLATLYGDDASKVTERVVGIDLDAKLVKELSNSTLAFGDFNDVRCATACGGKCVATSAKQSALLTFTIGVDGFAAGDSITFPDAPKLPPRNLGGY
jgi:hypothetical protein